MPRLDGSGPMGQGAGTGRGLGICEGRRTSEFRIGRRRSFFGLGRGFRMRRNYYANDYVDSKESLISEREYLKSRLDDIDKEIEKL
ncbi:MAG: DUF5320 domain-containing protein [Bacilli bacterium]|jgi:hypothetical protein|nr:DUF5320 domain-containing protein [Bacilli bacterium]MDD3121089.1 DUF5320 domain-containing protein [Bacilli bacterium]MDD4063773.1 DUF5320 domain-containing protein [Bacilli bacterium]MDD4482632.1 DUF5320 domain-containing protein [Bacilli bacterium]